MIRLPSSGFEIGGERLPVPAELRHLYMGANRKGRPGRLRRHTANREMTLCIAATCEQAAWPLPTGQCAILSYDRQISEPMAGSHEIGRKMERLAPRWWGLLASDNLDSGRDMMRFFRNGLADNLDSLTSNSALDILYGCLHNYQTELLNRFVHNECGLSLREFVALGESVNLDDAQREKIRRAISDGIVPKHEAIIVGWIPLEKQGAWHIFLLYDGEIIEKQDFAAIGSGCFIAHTMWNIRQRTVFRYLPGTLYRVYEAQRMGSAEPSVGVQGYLQVLTWSQDDVITMRSVESRSPDPDDYLTKLWGRFLGLSELTNDIKEESYRFHVFREKA
jgi:hypothetical protein